MTADDVYTVGGQSGGGAGHSGDSGAATSAYLDHPVAIVVDNGDQLYVADAGNNRVQEIAYSTHSEWGQSMTVDDIYTIAGSSSGVGGYSGDGGAATSAHLEDDSGIGLDSSVDLYVADSANNVEREVNVSTHDISTVAGTGGTLATTGDNASAIDAGLYQPTATTVDSAGNIYVADQANNRVQEIAATTHSQWGISMTAGQVYTILGSSDGTAGDSGDSGAATSAELDYPAGVALDAAGDLYVADGGNNRIQVRHEVARYEWTCRKEGRPMMSTA